MAIDRTAEDMLQDQKISNLEEALRELQLAVGKLENVTQQEAAERQPSALDNHEERIGALEDAIGPLEKFSALVTRVETLLEEVGDHV